LIAGFAFPLCCRCSGVVLGAVVTAIAFGDLAHSIPVALAFALPASIDWGMQRFRGIESTNVRRWATGALLGVACVFAPVPW